MENKIGDRYIKSLIDKRIDKTLDKPIQEVIQISIQESIKEDLQNTKETIKTLNKYAEQLTETSKVLSENLSKSLSENLSNIVSTAIDNNKPKKHISAATAVRNLILQEEDKLTFAQKMKLFDREFVSKHCGVSMDLFIPAEDDKKRYVRGRARYMKRPIKFMDKQLFMTNDIHEKSVERFKNLFQYFKSTGDVIPPPPIRKKTKRHI